MDTTERIAFGGACIVWIGIALGLVFSLANLKIESEDLNFHVKLVYFCLFLTFTAVGILYLKVFFSDKEKTDDKLSKEGEK